MIITNIPGGTSGRAPHTVPFTNACERFSTNLTKQMYVSTGLGQSVPIRLRVPPEATIFTLRANPK